MLMNIEARVAILLSKRCGLREGNYMPCQLAIYWMLVKLKRVFFYRERVLIEPGITKLKREWLYRESIIA